MADTNRRNQKLSLKHLTGVTSATQVILKLCPATSSSRSSTLTPPTMPTRKLTFNPKGQVVT